MQDFSSQAAGGCGSRQRTAANEAAGRTALHSRRNGCRRFRRGRLAPPTASHPRRFWLLLVPSSAWDHTGGWLWVAIANHGERAGTATTAAGCGFRQRTTASEVAGRRASYLPWKDCRPLRCGRLAPEHSHPSAIPTAAARRLSSLGSSSQGLIVSTYVDVAMGPAETLSLAVCDDRVKSARLRRPPTVQPAAAF